MRATLAVLMVLLVPMSGCGAKTPLAEVEAKIERGIAGIVLGADHTCANFREGTLKCWGWNGQGQLGDGTIVRRLTPTLVPSLEGVAAVSLGHGHSCALMDGGGVKCWGDRSFGQVGDGIPLTDFTAPSTVLEPIDVVGLGPGSGVAQISLGEAHSCALVGGGSVYCWGVNDIGELGDGRRDRSSAPRAVVGIADATQIAVGSSHSCALLRGGGVKCWGSDEDGQLGGSPSEFCGSYQCARTPLVVTDIDGIVEVAVGGNRTCLRTSAGAMLCFGRSVERADFIPTAIAGMTGVEQMALGQLHTCVRKTDGTVWCWGSNGAGQLGFVAHDPCPSAPTAKCALLPTQVTGVTNAVQISAGGDHTCVRTSDAQVKCWGNNTNGQVGDGTTIDRYAPVPVSL